MPHVPQVPNEAEARIHQTLYQYTPANNIVSQWRLRGHLPAHEWDPLKFKTPHFNKISWDLVNDVVYLNSRKLSYVAAKSRAHAAQSKQIRVCEG